MRAFLCTMKTYIPQSRVEVYCARDGWRWRMVGKNNRIIATGEAYSRLHDAKRGASRATGIAIAKIKVLE